MTKTKHSFSEIIFLALLNWNNFKGRLDRRSYWIAFVPFHVTLFLFMMLFINSLSYDSYVLILLSFVLLMTTFTLTSSMTVRRLNDVNINGTWYWIAFAANAACSTYSAFSNFSELSPLPYQNIFVNQIYLILISLFSLALAIWVLIKTSMPSIKEKLPE
jgi:uncharacterized membrane protein YhaH (DUF805 family)